MITFFTNKGATNKLTLYVTLSGSPVTGLIASSFGCRATKNGAAGASVTLTGLVSELDAVNMPGIYTFNLPSSLFDTLGYVVLRFAGVGFDPIVVYCDNSLQSLSRDIRSLSHGSFKLTVDEYDGAGNVEEATLELFDVAANIEVATPRLTLTATSTYNEDGTLATFEVVEN